MFSPLVSDSLSTSDINVIYTIRINLPPQDYDSQLSEKKENIYKNIVDDNNNLYYSYSIRKEQTDKNISLLSQRFFFEWLFTNISSISATGNILEVIDEQSMSIYQSTKRSPANIMVIGNNILDEIKEYLTQEYYSYNNEKYDGDEYSYVGTYKKINVFTLKDPSIVPDNFAILSYVGRNMDASLISHKVDNTNYLQVIRTTEKYSNDYHQYIRIINLNKDKKI